MIKGVNVIGHINGQFGLGKAVRLNLKAMESAKIPLEILDYKTSSLQKILDLKHPINFIQISLNEVDDFLNTVSSSFFNGTYSIIFLVWESENVTEKFEEIINLFDEVWTASSYCKQIFEKFYDGPITVIPHPVEIKICPTDNKLPLEIYAKTKFSFLFVFDFNSSAIRKNPFFLVEAFKAASLKLNHKIELILKTSNSEHHPIHFNKLCDLSKKFPNIKIINDRLSRNDLNHLLNNCDSYISLHHSEGFGLTIAEAMALGKPTIATNYSGNTEYMTEENSYLVDTIISPIEEIDVHFDKNTVWGNPNFEDSVQKIISIYQNTKDSFAKGQKAKENILDKLSYNSIGSLMDKRIDIILEDFEKVNTYKKQIRTLKNQLISLDSDLIKTKKELKKIKKNKLIKLILFFKKWFRYLIKK